MDGEAFRAVSAPGSMMNRLRIFILLPLFLALAACDMVVLNPSGDIAAQQPRELVLAGTEQSGEPDDFARPDREAGVDNPPSPA